MEELEPRILVMPFGCGPGFPAHDKCIRKVTLSSPCLHPVLVRNAETQHLIHKVQEEV
jgi:hypothetical protein